MSDRIRMAESDRPPEENTEPQPAEEKPPQPPEEPPREEGPEPPPPSREAEEGEQPPRNFKDFQQRLERERRQTWQARTEAQQYLTQLREFQQRFEQWQQQGQGQPANQNANAREQAKAELRQEMAVDEFNRQCDAVYARGKAEFPDFDDAVQALLAVGVGSRADFLAAVTQMPEPHKLYRQLASDLDNTARIMRLSPIGMSVELAKIALELTGKIPQIPVSRAPAPIKPIGGGGRGPRRLQDMSMDEYVKHRDKEEAERRR